MRRPFLILTTTLLTLPLAAQTPVIAPGPSMLFRVAFEARADTTAHRPRVSVLRGAGIGAAAGLVIGAALGAYQASGRPCSCDDPGLEPFVGGFFGTVVGFVVGASIADERRQQEQRRVEPPPPGIGLTENGTPVTGDSTRLVGRDPHGVRGGIAGALMGGAFGYAVPHLAYSIEHAGGSTDGAGGGAGGPSALAVGVSTLTGAVSGYLVAALISRR